MKLILFSRRRKRDKNFRQSYQIFYSNACEKIMNEQLLSSSFSCHSTIIELLPQSWRFLGFLFLKHFGNLSLNPDITNVPHHIETSRFGLRISWLVFIWWGTLVVPDRRQWKPSMIFMIYQNMVSTIFETIGDGRWSFPDLIGKTEFVSILSTWSGTISNYSRLAGTFMITVNMWDFYDLVGDRPRLSGIFTTWSAIAFYDPHGLL